MAKKKVKRIKRRQVSKAEAVSRVESAMAHLERITSEQPAPEVEAVKVEVEATAKVSTEEIKRLTKLGLVEIPIRGTPYTLIGLAEPDKAPASLEQRVEMAKRLNAVGPLLPRYIGTIGHLIDEKKPHASTQAVVDVAQSIASGVEVSKQLTKEKSKLDKKAKASKVATKPAAAAKPAEKDAAKPEKAAKKDKALNVPKVPAGGFKKESAPATSGELIRARIAEHKLTDEEIAKEVVKLFPGRSTKVSDVRWNRGQMRKRGIDAPDPVGGEPEKKTKKAAKK